MPPPELELQCDNASAVLPTIQEKISNIGDILNLPCTKINLNDMEYTWVTILDKEKFCLLVCGAM
jgi:hypothetical protein